MWTYWHENGQKQAQGAYIQPPRNSISDESSFYRYVGSGKAIKEGQWLYWYPNGKISNKEFYQNKQLNGLTEHFYENGQKQEEGAYQNDLKEGIWTFYHANGQI